VDIESGYLITVNETAYVASDPTSLSGAGTYQLQFVIPLGDMVAAFSTQNASTDPTTSSSANSSGYTSDFTVADGEVWLAENVGLTGIAL